MYMGMATLPTLTTLALPPHRPLTTELQEKEESEVRRLFRKVGVTREIVLEVEDEATVQEVEEVPQGTVSIEIIGEIVL
jgi:hypothetical protein